MSDYFLTPERHKELQEELARLKTSGRQEVSDLLKESKAMGDLSENFEYQEAREEKSQLEQKIGQLEEILRNSKIIKKDGKKTDAVQVGAVVKLKKDNQAVSYSIVGSKEADPANGLISNESPLGQLLIGKKVGDHFRLKTVKGEFLYQILDID